MKTLNNYQKQELAEITYDTFTDFFDDMMADYPEGQPHSSDRLQICEYYKICQILDIKLDDEVVDWVKKIR